MQTLCFALQAAVRLADPADREGGLAWAMMIHIQQQEDLILHLAGYSCQIMSDR